jgi:hypothetical protein
MDSMHIWIVGQITIELHYVEALISFKIRFDSRDLPVCPPDFRKVNFRIFFDDSADINSSMPKNSYSH